jgi:hypothetical protein
VIERQRLVFRHDGLIAAFGLAHDRSPSARGLTGHVGAGERELAVRDEPDPCAHGKGPTDAGFLLAAHRNVQVAADPRANRDVNDLLTDQGDDSASELLHPLGHPYHGVLAMVAQARRQRSNVSCSSSTLLMSATRSFGMSSTVLPCLTTTRSCTPTVTITSLSSSA